MDQLLLPVLSVCTLWRLRSTTLKPLHDCVTDIVHALGRTPNNVCCPLKVLFGCSLNRINSYVLGWIEVELELNSTPNHSNTRGFWWIR